MTKVMFMIYSSPFSRECKMSLRQLSRRLEVTMVCEFKNTRIEDLCDDLGMGHQFSPTYTPQSNGVVERKNRTLIDMDRSMLSEYNVSHSF
jgi:transposase InsO family protein